MNDRGRGESAETKERGAAWAVRLLRVVALAAFGSCVWRAATAAITHDEAFTYLQWARKPWSALHEGFLANNHVLHTALVKIAADLFGPEPFVLRLPALLAGAVFILLLLVFVGRPGRRVWTLLPLAALLLNPLLLELFSCARGYAPALACQLGVFLLLLRSAREPGRCSPLVGAGLLGGLAIAFNPTFAVVIVAMILTFLIIEREAPDGRALRLLLVRLAALVLPAAAVLVPTLGPILGDLNPAVLHFGACNPAIMLEGIARLWIDHVDPDWPWRDPESVSPSLLEPALVVVLSVLAMVVMIAGSHAKTVLRGRLSTLESNDRAAVLAACSFVLGLALVLILAFALDMPLPHKRTLIPFVVLAQLALVGAAAGRSRLLALLANLVALVLVAAALRSFPAAHYAQWRYDSASERVFEELQARRLDDRPLRVLVQPWIYTPSLDFYRVSRDADWMEGVDWLVEPGQGYDYVVVADFFAKLPHVAPHLEAPLFRDSEAGVLICRPRIPEAN